MKIQLKIFLSVALLGIFTISVSGGCAERIASVNENSAKDDNSSSVTDLIADIGCSIQRGAKKVKDSVEDGYRILKEKLSSAVDENDKISNIKGEVDQSSNRNNVVSDDRITFMDNQEQDGGETDEVTTEHESLIKLEPMQPDNANKTVAFNITLDDRTSLSAPEMCPKGYVRTESGKCERPVNL